MGHYTKLAILLIRASGVLMVVYAAFMTAWAVITSVLQVGGDAQASTRGSHLFAWFTYLLAGTLLILLARRLGVWIGRELDATTSPPAA